MNDVRAAAERLRKDDYYGPGRIADLIAKKNADMKLLANAYLSEHPADGDLPIDEAWLRSIGFAEGWYGLKMHGKTGGLIEYRPEESIWIVNHQAYQLSQWKTRSDLRRLLAALGIEAKEGGV